MIVFNNFLGSNHEFIFSGVGTKVCRPSSRCFAALAV